MPNSISATHVSWLSVPNLGKKILNLGVLVVRKQLVEFVRHIPSALETAEQDADNYLFRHVLRFFFFNSLMAPLEAPWQIDISGLEII
jgi:hypothetical protein